MEIELCGEASTPYYSRASDPTLLRYGYTRILNAFRLDFDKIILMSLIGAFGVHHDSELNAFNLADDLIEPFRPFVDMRVWNMYEKYVEDNLPQRGNVRSLLITNSQYERMRILLGTEKYEEKIGERQLVLF